MNLLSSVFALVTIVGIVSPRLNAQTDLPHDHAASRSTISDRKSGPGIPYLDFPLVKLQRLVPELRGLEPGTSQDRLPLILAKVGAVTGDLVQRIPNLTCHEQVIKTQGEPTALSHSEALEGPHPREFNYLIVAHQGPSGGKSFDEYRTDPQNSRTEVVEQSVGSPRAHGFTYTWLIFFPSNQPESNFRYLGRQKIDHRWTLVLAFTQKPNSVKSPPQVEFEGKWLSVLYQGIAWIEESTFRIVRLRTDLLSPPPGIPLERLSAILHFGEAKIPHTASDLWLPRQVDTVVELNQHISTEVHLYSNYQLYAVSTKIITSAPR